jgi:hypothetical protein
MAAIVQLPTSNAQLPRGGVRRFTWELEVELGVDLDSDAYGNPTPFNLNCKDPRQSWKTRDECAARNPCCPSDLIGTFFWQGWHPPCSLGARDLASQTRITRWRSRLGFPSNEEDGCGRSAQGTTRFCFDVSGKAA